VILQRFAATRGIAGHGAKQIGQGVRAVLIETRPCPAAYARHGLKGVLHSGVATFLEQKQRQFAQAALSRELADIICRLFQRIANKYQAAYGVFLMYGEGVTQQAPDLRVTALAAHTRHLLRQGVAVSQPRACLEFLKTTVIAQLNADRGQLAGTVEHGGLSVARHGPGGLATGGGVDGEDKPWLSLRKNGNGLGGAEKSLDVL